MLGFASKRILQGWARRLGYEIERIRPSLDPIDPFELAVQLLLARQRSFFFLQIGANDGVSDDPLRAMILKYHLEGILVEPQPEAFKRLVQNYRDEPQLKLENVAISRNNGTTTMYIPASNMGGADLLSSFDRDVLAQRLSSAEIREIEVQTSSLASILERNGNRKIDLLQVDTEGYDFEILKMVDFSRWAPSIINFEHINLTDDDYRQCLELLAAHGYRTAIRGIDTLGIHESLLERTSSAPNESIPVAGQEDRNIAG